MATSVYVNDQTIILLYGFTRKLNKHLNQSMPDHVLLICARFRGLPVDEYFAKGGGKYDVEDQGRILRNTKETWKDQSVFGNVFIDSFRKRVHFWTFQVLKLSKRYGYLGIGITNSSENERDATDAFWNNKKSHNYYAIVPGVLLVNETVFGKDWECQLVLGVVDGSIVKMTLNLKTKKLIFHVDDECIGAVDNDIECGEDICYKMAVSFGLGSVKLMDYTHSE